MYTLTDGTYLKQNKEKKVYSEWTSLCRSVIGVCCLQFAVRLKSVLHCGNRSNSGFCLVTVGSVCHHFHCEESDQ